jgi:hypothetical protein
VRGKAMLYRHCETYGVPFERCGKIIAAPTTQYGTLRGYQRRAIANGGR